MKTPSLSAMSTDICDCRSLSESYASIAPSINTNPHYVSSSHIRKTKKNVASQMSNVNCQRKWWFSVEDRGFLLSGHKREAWRQR